MTNKEAKEKLYIEWQKFLEDNIDYAGISKAYQTAFKALEQEPILDEIRAEIAEKIVIRPALNHSRTERDRNDAFLEILDIIDKYRDKEQEE